MRVRRRPRPPATSGIDERPDPVPGRRRGPRSRWSGAGSAAPTSRTGSTAPPGPPCSGSRWCSGTRSPAGSPGRRRVSAVSRSGQPVTVHPAELVGDGRLPDRLAGRTNLYPRIRYFGSAAFDPHTDGGFSEQRVVRAAQIRPAARRRRHRARRARRAPGRRHARRAAGPGTCAARRAGQRRRPDRLAGRGRRQAPRRGHGHRRGHRRGLARRRPRHGRGRDPQPRRRRASPRT